MGGYQPVTHRVRQGKRTVKPPHVRPDPHHPWPGAVSARG